MLVSDNQDLADFGTVMICLREGTIAQYVGRPSEPQLHAVAMWLAKTLNGFHLKAGGHGDLKPLNVLVNRDGHLKLGDPLGNGFGLGVLFSPDKGGTEGYRAPEVVMGATPSARSATYSFAATIYHLVMGRAPVDGQNLGPTANGFGCPEWIRQLIVLCSRPDPDSRPSMNETLTALQGESWASIYAQRQKDTAIAGILVLGLATLGIAALLSKSAAA